MLKVMQMVKLTVKLMRRVIGLVTKTVKPMERLKQKVID